MRILALAFVVALVACLPAVARATPPPGFGEAKNLEPAASYVARKPVSVLCATSPAVWRQYVNAARDSDAEAIGFAVPGSSEILLEYGTCNTLRDARKGLTSYLATYMLAPAVEALTHEAIHTRGEADEGRTECSAMHEAPGVAVRFLHVRAGKQLRSLMAEMWKAHRALPSQYRVVC